MAVSSLGDNAGAIAIAKPRWEALHNSPDADAAVLELASCLAFAHAGLGQYDEMGPYVDRAVVSAEATNDLRALSRVLRQMATRHSARGAQITALALNRAAADIARDLGLQDELSGALTIQVSIQFSRDLAAAMANSREGVEAARRGGVRNTIDTSVGNHLLALWAAGSLAEARELLSSSTADAQGQVHPFLQGISRWVDDALGLDPEEVDISEVAEAGDDEYALAWWGHTQMVQALDRGATTEAALIAERTLPHVLAACALTDEFVFHWPPLVLAALAARDPELAERLMEPVTTSRASLPPYLDAQRLRLQGPHRSSSGR